MTYYYGKDKDHIEFIRLPTDQLLLVIGNEGTLIKPESSPNDKFFRIKRIKPDVGNSVSMLPLSRSNPAIALIKDNHISIPYLGLLYKVSDKTDGHRGEQWLMWKYQDTITYSFQKAPIMPKHMKNLISNGRLDSLPFWDTYVVVSFTEPPKSSGSGREGDDLATWFAATHIFHVPKQDGKGIDSLTNILGEKYSFRINDKGEEGKDMGTLGDSNILSIKLSGEGRGIVIDKPLKPLKQGVSLPPEFKVRYDTTYKEMQGEVKKWVKDTKNHILGDIRIEMDILVSNLQAVSLSLHNIGVLELLDMSNQLKVSNKRINRSLWNK